ncbi:MAG: YCF48-related protein, partial [Pirellulaceae bacterium]|nr:YCF48-related protein [Pirellulaceae bacterium]
MVAGRGIAAFLVCCLVGPTLWAAPPEALTSMESDARLNDVFFLNAERGWAVGDRGVIWSTSDGGATWSRQRADIRCQLYSVFFVDEERGWAVGGWVQPYSWTSRGVVLRTNDGGRSWVRDQRTTLPALKRVVFFDRLVGWALGDSSSMYPAGVFRTRDGGQSWRTVPSGATRRLLAGDFASPRRGVVAGRDGGLHLVLDREITSTRTPDVGERSLRSVRLSSAGHGWLVGDGGLLLRTDDGGASWVTPEARPRRSADHIDFSALAISGDTCWVAGSPGAEIHRTRDGGRSWSTHPTGQTLPINSIFFFDSLRGWAVGALGLVMHTDDGGETWVEQRSGGSRLALLAFLTDTETAPVELIVQHAAEQGYLSRAEVVLRRDADGAAESAATADRFHQAIVNSGGSSGDVQWRFAATERGLSVDATTARAVIARAADGRGADELLRHLVQQLRTWRPEVVVVEDSSSPWSRLLRAAVLQAVQAAESPTSFVEQLTEDQLNVWRVKRVVGVDRGGPRGGVLATTTLAPRLGKTLVDYGAHARGLLTAEFTPAPDYYDLRLLHGNGTSGMRGDLFAGMHISPGGDLRRHLDDALVRDIASLHRLAQRRRNAVRLLDSMGDEQALAWSGQIESATRGLDADSAAQIAFLVADRLAATGRADMAADALHHLVRAHADSELAEAALIRLVQHYSSGEASWRMKRSTKFKRQIARAVEPSGEAPREPRRVQPAALGANVQVTADRKTASAAGGVEQQSKLAVELGELIKRTRPELYMNPRLRLPLSVAQRRVGFGREADNYLQQLARDSTHPIWRDCARTELWMGPRQGLPPKKVAQCFA